jgi:hypothetical protein
MNTYIDMPMKPKSLPIILVDPIHLIQVLLDLHERLLLRGLLVFV